MTVEEWAQRYGRAWEDADEDAVAALFTEDAVYRSAPFREPYRGEAEIRAYWRRGAGSAAGGARAHGQAVRRR